MALEKDYMTNMGFEFKNFGKEEPKINYEETLILDDDEKGVSVYSSERIIINQDGNFFIGKYRKRISNYDNRVEEQFVDIEVPENISDKIIKENFIIPLSDTKWSYLPKEI